MQRVLQALGFIRYLWLLLGLTLVLLLALDGLLDKVLPDPYMNLTVVPGAKHPERTRMDAFAGHADVERYFQEFEAARHVEWRPYVYFRRKPFSGTAITVDAHGFRHTPQSEDARLQLWLFGGSMAWGTGVSDEQTLAAQLSQRLRQAGLAVRVWNFAESGWVSQQNLAMLALALRCPKAAPDAVVFVDGVNDVYAALQNQRAGWPQNEANRRVEFNLSRRADRVLAAWLARLKGVAKVLQPAPQKPALATLADDLVHDYLATTRQARVLAADYGARTLFAWQPSLVDKEQRSRDEQAAFDAMLAWHAELQQLSTQKLRAQTGTVSDLIVLDRTFAQDPAPAFFDYAHLNSEGIRKVVDALLPRVIESLNRPSADEGDGPVTSDKSSFAELPECDAWPVQRFARLAVPSSAESR